MTSRRSIYAVRRNELLEGVPAVSVLAPPLLISCPATASPGEWITVTGKNLLDVSRVVLDDGLFDCEYTFDPLTRSLSVRVPASVSIGTVYDLKAYAPGGTSTIFAAFTATGTGSVPVVVSVLYDLVTTAGGGQRQVVEVDSSVGCTSILVTNGFSTAFLTGFAIDDATHVSGVMPACPGAAGSYDVAVSNATGTSTTGAGLIEYWHVSQLAPELHVQAGGYVVGDWTDVGSRADDLVQPTPAVQPAVGALLGGIATVDFDGADDFLATSTGVGASVGTSLFMWSLFNADTSTPRDPNYDGNLLAEQGNAEFGLDFSDDGIGFTVLRTAYLRSPAVACGTGAWHLALAMVDADDVGAEGKVALDGGAWQTFVVTGGYGAAAPGAASVGKGYAARWFDGLIADAGIVNGTVSAPNIVRLRKYMNQLYGVNV